MNMKLINIFSIILIAFVALTGCEKLQRMVGGGLTADTSMDETMTDTDAIPVKFVFLVDYPKGGKDAYIAWIASIAPTLQAPEEIVRIRSYDNIEEGMSPDRLVEFEFNSFLDAATYFSLPEIFAVFEDLPNRATKVNVHAYIERSDYSKTEDDNWPIKGVLFIDYPLDGKETYLKWVESVSSILIAPPELKATSAYDNYYGGSPHRFVTLEFANQEDLEFFEDLEEIKTLEAELDVQTSSWTLHKFELRSDYISE